VANSGSRLHDLYVVDGPETDVPLCCVDSVAELTAKRKFTVNVTDASGMKREMFWKLGFAGSVPDPVPTLLWHSQVLRVDCSGLWDCRKPESATRC